MQVLIMGKNEDANVHPGSNHKKRLGLSLQYWIPVEDSSVNQINHDKYTDLSKFDIDMNDVD